MKSLKLALNRRQWMLTILVILVILVVFVWSKANFTGKNRIISTVSVEVLSDSTSLFLNQEEVIDFVKRKVDEPIGKSASEISLTKIEVALLQLPYVEKVTAYIGFDGELKIKINQRKPIMAVQNVQGTLFYIDSAGYQMPAKDGVQPNVIIATGEIRSAATPGKVSALPIMSDLKALGNYLNTHPFWDAQFEQCYVDKNLGILLIPRIGKHSIVLDNATNMDQKFENLRLFYKKGLQEIGWNRYSQIDISIPNQVIGRLSVAETEHTKTKPVHK